MGQPGEEIPFAIKLESDEQLSVKLISDTLRDVERMLADIEKHMFDRENAKAEWKWPEGADLEVVATVNGLDRDQLSRIVHEAEKGFSEAKEAKGPVIWPKSFGPTAKACAGRILSRLDKLDSIVVRAEQGKPITITSAEVSQRVIGRAARRRTAYSSIEGKLELISHRGRLRAAIKENLSGIVVQCIFPDEMIEEIKDLFDKKVVLEGQITYRENGEPISATRVSSVIERKPGRPLRDYIGAAPDLTGGVSSEEFIARIRG